MADTRPPGMEIEDPEVPLHQAQPTPTRPTSMQVVHTGNVTCDAVGKAGWHGGLASMTRLLPPPPRHRPDDCGYVLAIRPAERDDRRYSAGQRQGGSSYDYEDQGYRHATAPRAGICR